jgi:hypothetical protein
MKDDARGRTVAEGDRSPRWLADPVRWQKSALVTAPQGTGRLPRALLVPAVKLGLRLQGPAPDTRRRSLS